MSRIRAVVTLLTLGVFLSFTKASPGLSSVRFASESPFKLPLPPGVYVEVTQGNNMPPPDWDHNALSAYAFDFALLTGTYHFVVTAAQGGKVIAVDDSSTIQCDGLDHEFGAPKNVSFPGCWTHANYVLIADDDGKTAALYMHLLTHSAKVRVGYHVQQGQQLALADTTGYALGNPHLHFQVEDIPSIPSNPQQSPGWWFTQSVPVSFSDPELLKVRSDGVPITYDKICLGDKTCSSTPPPTILPRGTWTNPSPQNGQTVYDVIHFAAHASPTHPGDPAIAQVNFTVGSKGAWRVACTAVPPGTGDVFACDANLKDLGISYGQIQVSFDVYDQAGNVNLAPNGIHTLTYMPAPDFTPFVGVWYAHAQEMTIHANGTATYGGRVFVWCTDDPRPPCDSITGGAITGGLSTQITFTSVNGNTATGTITGGTGDRNLDGSIIPVGSPISVTLNANDTLNVSDGSLLCGPQAIQNQVDPGCTSGA